MAQATTTKFSDFLILLGDGATPETFTAPCGLTSRGFNRSANLSDVNVPDCVDEDAPSWLERDVISYQSSIAGAGVIADESASTWEDWWESGLAKNVRIERKTAAWVGSFYLTEYNMAGERGQRLTGNITLTSNGKVTRLSS
jgi:predicted secreted protein